MKLPRAHARGIFSPCFVGSEIHPKRKLLRIHPRTYVRGFLRRRINQTKIPLLPLLCLIFLVLVSFFNLDFPTKSLLKDKTHLVKNFPELKVILGDNQEEKLKATRALVERIGVEKTLEVLKISGLPFTGEGHLAVHQVGFYAYKKYGVDSILHCKDYFLYACYHGAIIEAATDHGFEVIGKMADRCKELASRYFQCAHASGHAILAIWNYDLPKALKTCDQVFEKETKFPDTLTSCHNGSFMENLFGVHDWGTGETPKRDWLSSDLFFPCNAFSEKYQKGCWLNQAARIYQVYSGDIVKTKETCERIGNFQYTIWCIDNLARQIHPLTNGDITKVFELCQYVGSFWRENCILINAGSYYSVGDRFTGINICNNIDVGAKQACFQNIISQILSEKTSTSEKKALCKKIETNFQSKCLSQI